MIDANEFYEVNLTKQREIINKKIEEAKNIGDPVIILPFDLYVEVKEELSRKNWSTYYYRDKLTGKRCAFIYPKNYKVDYTQIIL